MNTLDLLRAISDGFLDCFTIVDCSNTDRLCISVNTSFTLQTGYSAEEVLGKNLSFLQGEATSSNAVESMRVAFEEQKAVAVDLVNYRKNGSPFLNRLVMVPLQADGRLLYLGMQNNIAEGADFLNQQALSSNSEIQHVLNNLLTGLFLTTEEHLEATADTYPEPMFEAGAEFFRSINYFCRNLENLHDFKTYNPFSKPP